MITGIGKSVFTEPLKTYLCKAALKHINTRPIVIIGRMGSGVGHYSMAIASQINSTIITVKNLSEFVESGGCNNDIIQAYAAGHRVIVHAQSFDELRRSGLNYSNF
ncbi:hypothetical protein ERJ77_27525, partial [Vibrio anguillarum]|nr:hypothetical protein [Vibrio anguillarum]